ncbi:MAG: HAMP domain-containing sensor histidine kinase [Parvularcula sp.]|nr:HAMP domain-containing sensor histidine kinase [Parvularcula sp.]
MPPAATKRFRQDHRWLRRYVVKLVHDINQVFSLRQVPTERLLKQLRDYELSGRALFWQKQGMYLSSGLLAGFYYDLFVAIIFFAFMQLAELLEVLVARRLRLAGELGRRDVERFHTQYLRVAAFGAVVVSFFALTIASYEPLATHFTPLFYLFAAGLFASINNNQLPVVLAVSCGIYAMAFIAIPIGDLIVTRPDLSSRLWLQLATVLVVLFFIFECGRSCLYLYRRALDQLEQLRDERDRARDAYELKSQFVSTVSHELRTPLTSILGSLSLLKSPAFTNMPKERDEVIDLAYRNSRRLADLIDDLLDLQKIESSQMQYKFGSLDVGRATKDMISLMTGYQAQKGVTFHFDAEVGLKNARADRMRFEQVLKNLLSNAVKFSHPGGKVVVRAKNDDNCVLIEVIDQGVGIPENSEDLVFGKFTQVDASDRRTHQGTGLGLAIAEQIVKAHGGSLTYRSALGEGTSFDLRIPLAEGESVATRTLVRPEPFFRPDFAKVSASQ